MLDGWNESERLRLLQEGTATTVQPALCLTPLEDRSTPGQWITRPKRIRIPVFSNGLCAQSAVVNCRSFVPTTVFYYDEILSYPHSRLFLLLSLSLPLLYPLPSH